MCSMKLAGGLKKRKLCPPTRVVVSVDEGSGPGSSLRWRCSSVGVARETADVRGRATGHEVKDERFRLHSACRVEERDAPERQLSSTRLPRRVYFVGRTQAPCCWAARAPRATAGVSSMPCPGPGHPRRTPPPPLPPPSAPRRAPRAEHSARHDSRRRPRSQQARRVPCARRPGQASPHQSTAAATPGRRCGPSTSTSTYSSNSTSNSSRNRASSCTNPTSDANTSS